MRFESKRPIFITELSCESFGESGQLVHYRQLEISGSLVKVTTRTGDTRTLLKDSVYGYYSPETDDNSQLKDSGSDCKFVRDEQCIVEVKSDQTRPLIERN